MAVKAYFDGFHLFVTDRQAIFLIDSTKMASEICS